MRLFPVLLALLVLTPSLPVCAKQANRAKQPERPVTILISIDGFRPDYRSPALTPNLLAIGAGGISGMMRPSFPSVTFPNHWTLATGLRPDRHGIVNGTMFDPSHRDAVFGKSSEEAWWWDAADPIWVSAAKAGKKASVMFWPGSSVAIGGVRPFDWAAYHLAYDNHQRVRTVLDWMRRPKAIRPDLVLLYFGDVDVAGHRKGVDAPETKAAIADVDKAIGELRAGLRALGRRANLVVVSDHGMARVDPARVVQLEDYVPASDFRLVSYGGILFVNKVAGHEEALAAGLQKLPDYIHCWAKGDLPARFHYGANARVADYTCLPDVGARILVGKPDKVDLGDHGYDPDAADMRALFIAQGPAFARGAKLPVFDNVDIEPLLRHLAGIGQGAPRDGSVAVFKPILRP